MPASSSTALFIEPLDVLILRGNKLFADAGSHSEALMPPWPSVAAGALRSRMLIDAGIDPAAFAAVLGSVAQPGSFRIAHFGLARRTGKDEDPLFEALLPLPADARPDQLVTACAALPDVEAELRPLFARWRDGRVPGERFGDFATRVLLPEAAAVPTP